jgi:predicted NAD/FAD-binding protein
MRNIAVIGAGISGLAADSARRDQMGFSELQHA